MVFDTMLSLPEEATEFYREQKKSLEVTLGRGLSFGEATILHEFARKAILDNSFNPRGVRDVRDYLADKVRPGDEICGVLLSIYQRAIVSVEKGVERLGYK